MLKPFAAVLLIVAFAAQTFNQAIIVLDYYANTSTFAKNCENKTKPMMHCNGKCQMMKKLREEEKKQQQNPERKIENKAEVISSKSFFAFLHPQKISIHLSILSRYSFFIPQGKLSDIFHPPSLV